MGVVVGRFMSAASTLRSKTDRISSEACGPPGCTRMPMCATGKKGPWDVEPDANQESTSRGFALDIPTDVSASASDRHKFPSVLTVTGIVLR